MPNCKTCNKKLTSKTGSGYCRLCWRKTKPGYSGELGFHCSGCNKPLENKPKTGYCWGCFIKSDKKLRGSAHPRWKEGPVYYRCPTCGDKKDFYAKECMKCAAPKRVRVGDRAPAWKGGLTEKHVLIRSSLKYKNWRKAVFERDLYTCVICGVRNRKGNKGTVLLQADHIKPFAYFPELHFQVENGRTLCRPCHFKTDTYGAKAIRFKPSG